MTASLLFELVAVQRATAEGSSISAVPASPLKPNTSFTPETLDIWVNGLWVLSLALALVVALAAVLVKQWLHRYTKIRSGPPGERSHRRHFRYIGFEKWHVLGIIGSLPIIMHLSLGIFFLGLTLFLIPSQLVLGCIIGTIAFVVYMLYSASNFLPVFFPQCPYRTPLSDFLIIVSPRFLRLVLKIRALFLAISGSSIPLDSQRFEPEDLAKSVTYQRMSLEALHWLYEISSNDSVHSIVVQAIGGLPVSVIPLVNSIFCYENLQRVHESLLHSHTSRIKDKNGSYSLQPKPGSESVVERLYRAFLFFPETEMWHYTYLASSSTDHRLTATFLAVYSGISGLMRPILDNCYTFVSSEYDSLTHCPLVWTRLFQNLNQLYRSGSLATVGSAKMQAFICKTSLSAVWGPRLLPTSLVTMNSAIRASEACRFEAYSVILRSLSAFDENLQLSIVTRVIMAVMKYALHYVTANPSDLESVYWEIIDYIFEESNTAVDLPMFQQDVFFSFMKGYVVLLIDKTDVCDARLTASDTILKHRTTVLEVYERTRLYLPPNSESQLALESEFRSLHRAVAGTISELTQVEHQDPFEDNRYSIIFHILSLALAHGREEGYQLMIDHEGFLLLSRYQFTFQLQSKMFITYVSGLNTVDAAHRETYIDYLYQSENLHYSVLSLHMWERNESDLDGLLNTLVQLRPDLSSWNECRHWLKDVLEWVTEVKKEGRQKGKLGALFLSEDSGMNG